MKSPFLLRLLLALVLVLNGAGSALAGARAVAAPASAAAAIPHRGAPAAHTPAEATASMPGCDVATTGPDAAARVDAAVPESPGHGHCCQDACHCVCTLQAHASPLLQVTLPRRTLASLASFPGWADPDPALLLRPPIA